MDEEKRDLLDTLIGPSDKRVIRVRESYHSPEDVPVVRQQVLRAAAKGLSGVLAMETPYRIGVKILNVPVMYGDSPLGSDTIAFPPEIAVEVVYEQVLERPVGYITLKKTEMYSQAINCDDQARHAYAVEGAVLGLTFDLLTLAARCRTLLAIAVLKTKSAPFGMMQVEALAYVDTPFQR